MHKNIEQLSKFSGEAKQKPKVSIIIPVFNGSNYLRDAINSALAQSYPHIEILVINDGSNDSGATEAIAQSYGNKIRYFCKPNGGVASALNFGISKMTGDYFSWLSHDDLYAKEKIELQVNYLVENNLNEVILYSNYSVFTSDPNKDVLMTMRGVPPTGFRYWITYENRLHGCTLLIPKLAFKKCGNFAENLYTTQDYDLWFRMAKDYQFIHLPTALVKSRCHIEQGSIVMKKLAAKECNKLLLKFVKNLSMLELQQMHTSPALGYANLASSMLYRGFMPAGGASAYLAIQKSFNSSFKDLVLVQCILAKGVLMHYMIKPIRGVFPPFLRLIIRKILNSLISFTKSQPASQKSDTYATLETMNLKDKFSTVYKQNLFNGQNSRSGEGSDLIQTEVIREEIPKLIADFKIHSMLDAPCGDWYWMKKTKLNLTQYIGADIVDDLIQKNLREYGNEQIDFKCLNLVTDSLPQVDLVFSRDCLVHLSFDDALKMIRNFKESGAKYILTTTFTDRQKNEDLGMGFWRPLNLQIAPFHFPTPLKLINEQCTEGDNLFTDKCLGLWQLADLSI